MKREELIKNKGYHIARIQNELFRQLHEFMEQSGMTGTQLARHLGVSKGYVSQVLNGNFDFKLSKLVELSLAMGMIPEISFIPIEKNNKTRTGKRKISGHLKSYSGKTEVHLVEEPDTTKRNQKKPRKQ